MLLANQHSGALVPSITGLEWLDELAREEGRLFGQFVAAAAAKSAARDACDHASDEERWASEVVDAVLAGREPPPRPTFNQAVLLAEAYAAEVRQVQAHQNLNAFYEPLVGVLRGEHAADLAAAIDELQEREADEPRESSELVALRGLLDAAVVRAGANRFSAPRPRLRRTDVERAIVDASF